MNLDSTSKSLQVRLGVIPDPGKGIYVIANGEVLTYVGDKISTFRPFNAWIQLTDLTQTTLVVAPVDVNTVIKVSSVYAYQPNSFDVDLWIIERDGGTSIPVKHVKLSPGDNWEQLVAGSQTLDACGSLKVKNTDCDAGDPSFTTGFSFSLDV